MAAPVIGEVKKPRCAPAVGASSTHFASNENVAVLGTGLTCGNGAIPSAYFERIIDTPRTPATAARPTAAA